MLVGMDRGWIPQGHQLGADRSRLQSAEGSRCLPRLGLGINCSAHSVSIPAPSSYPTPSQLLSHPIPAPSSIPSLYHKLSPHLHSSVLSATNLQVSRALPKQCICWCQEQNEENIISDKPCDPQPRLFRAHLTQTEHTLIFVPHLLLFPHRI